MRTKYWLAWPLLALLGLVAPMPHAGAQAPAAFARVQTPARGQLAAFFVAEGDYVQRGQLLIKLEGAGGAVYVRAPSAGRIRFVRPLPGGALAAYAPLATIEVPAPAAQLAHRD